MVYLLYLNALTENPTVRGTELTIPLVVKPDSTVAWIDFAP